VIALLAELAERFPKRGFDKLFQLIRRRGLVWNCLESARKWLPL